MTILFLGAGVWAVVVLFTLTLLLAVKRADREAEARPRFEVHDGEAA